MITILLYQKLQKKRQTPKGVSTPNEDINQEEGGKEEEVSLSQQQEDDRLEIKEETEVMDVEANLLSLPAIAEVRGGVSMSIEAPHQVLNLVMTITNAPIYATCTCMMYQVKKV